MITINIYVFLILVIWMGITMAFVLKGLPNTIKEIREGTFNLNDERKPIVKNSFLLSIPYEDGAWEKISYTISRNNNRIDLIFKSSKNVNLVFYKKDIIFTQL